MEILNEDGAQGRTRTGTGCPTRPSNVRVYQFRHLGSKNLATARRVRERDPGEPGPRDYWCGFAGAGAGAAGTVLTGVVVGAILIGTPLAGRAGLVAAAFLPWPAITV